MAKEPIEHKDIIGQDLHLGSYVSIARHNSMTVCSIVKITPKKLRVVPIKGYPSEGWLIYPQDVILLSGPDALVYILKYKGVGK